MRKIPKITKKDKAALRAALDERDKLNDCSREATELLSLFQEARPIRADMIPTGLKESAEEANELLDALKRKLSDMVASVTYQSDTLVEIARETLKKYTSAIGLEKGKYARIQYRGMGASPRFLPDMSADPASFETLTKNVKVLGFIVQHEEQNLVLVCEERVSVPWTKGKRSGVKNELVKLHVAVSDEFCFEPIDAAEFENSTRNGLD